MKLVVSNRSISEQFIKVTAQKMWLILLSEQWITVQTAISTTSESKHAHVHLLSMWWVFLSYSGKLLREKTFVNFAILWLDVKVFSCNTAFHRVIALVRKEYYLCISDSTHKLQECSYFYTNRNAEWNACGWYKKWCKFLFAEKDGSNTYRKLHKLYVTPDVRWIGYLHKLNKEDDLSYDYMYLHKVRI